ncbi:GNAT family N-acetyltransferase [Algoriphagus chordae]|uniref:Acetyltransferase (GNAT) family protein n=1 Tax=Algoriphagus chordae TaxID=237019 RepID=A0A2W7R184_9BACT|nr:GNAT family N-acetyltransferase [Algoriphagus chordae]PZX51990.1 acetyltransferase (GNAT) family protein [Algoriphagus chordae]
MNFIKSTDPNLITELRQKLFQKLTAPIDAMWELLYIASAQSFLIEDAGKTIGYCCIDEQDSLLQLFLLDEYLAKMAQVIASLIDSKLINSASLSSNEPVSFNACLRRSASTQTNTFCYQHSNKLVEVNPDFSIDLVSVKDIPVVKTFLKEQIEMDDTFGYTENLVSRKEIYLVRESEIIIATSECRMSDSQPEIADLGIIVNRDHHGNGIATQVMKMQVNRVLKSNRKPICSTTVDNIPSQKVIEKSGFYCSNIIFDMKF